MDVVSDFAMKKLFIVQIFMFLLYSAVAQQDPQFSHAMISHVSFNPAYVGSAGNWNFSVIRRNQWAGFDGAPQTSVVSLDFPFKIGKSDNGLGLLVMSDELGMQKDTRLMMNYAYKKKLFSGTLSFGLSLGIINESFEGDFIIPDGEYFTPPGQDPLLNGTKLDVSDIMFDTGLGLFYDDKNMCIGLSVTHLLEPSIKLTKSSEYFYKKHYFLYGKYVYKLSEETNVMPSFNINTDFNTAQYSVGTNFSYKDKYWFGTSYRYEDAFVLLGGIRLFNGIRLGYAYDISTSEMGKHSGGSHEFMLSYSYSIKMDSKKQKFKSVRFL